MRTVEVLGVPVSAGRFDEALAFLAERVARREPTVISCANAWSLVLALDDPEHRARLARADLLLADGMPVVWIARLRGVRASRVHADDLMLAACAAFPRWGHFLVGGAEGQPERVADALRRRLPGIEIAGQRATPVRPVPAQESEAIVEAIRRSGAGMVWVGMGTPAQDTWMHAFAHGAGVPMAGVGSAFDLLSGRTRPVPKWAKRSGLQWLFRLAQEPRRLGPRYLTTNPRFLWHAARELARGCEPRVSLRPATTADAQRLFEWRNEEATRRASFSSDPIPWVAHEIWLADRLAPDSRTRIFLVLDARDREVGYVRFDVDLEGSAEVSVAIDARERGRGLGTAAIRAATERIAADAGVRRVVARVRPENRASRMAFGRAGYTEMASDIFERIIAPGPS